MGRRKGNRRLAASASVSSAPASSGAQSPSARLRPATIAWHGLLVLAALAVVAGFTIGGRALAGWLRTSESFSVQTVDVSGHQTLLVEEILDRAGIEEGMSMFEIDEQLAGTELETHPWIRSASVVKHMPDKVIIEVTERELSAMVYAGGLWHVDSDGTIFEKHEPPAPIDQVIITGVDEDWMGGDEEQLRTELCKIIQILDEYERMGLSIVAPVKTVHREHGGGIVLYIGDHAREVRLGQGHTRKKLKRLREVLRQLRKEKLAWDYIMVDSRNFPERVVVKLQAS